MTLWMPSGHSPDDGCWIATCRLCGQTLHNREESPVCPLCRYGSLRPYSDTPMCHKAGCRFSTASEVVPRIHIGCVEHTRAAKVRLNGVWTTVGALIDHRMEQLRAGELLVWDRNTGESRAWERID